MASPSRPNTYRPASGPSNSGFQKRNGSFNRNKTHRGPRRNEALRMPSIRVVGPAGEALGIMATPEALALAKKLQLDLIEIAPNASPPVCRIMDFGKYMYEENKKQSNTKKNSSKLKEIKLRPNIDTHDYETKTRRAEDFLVDGHKVKFTITMRGREMDNPRVALDLFRRIVETLKETGALPDPHFIPKPSGRNLSFMLSPTPNAKRKVAKEDDEETEKPLIEGKKRPDKLSSPFESL